MDSKNLSIFLSIYLYLFKVWFQNKRSKERKGKISKEKETPMDDDEGVDDSPPSSPTPIVSAPLTIEQTSTPTESVSDPPPIETSDI